LNIPIVIVPDIIGHDVVGLTINSG